ncbi:MAG TPA: fatty acid desaturase [Myxococcaceae bacterium]|nr:fatty acid desaturase [Myxococcaceae bacterium]
MESSSTARTRPGALLRFSADRRTLGILLVYAALVVAAWVLLPDGPLQVIAIPLLGYSSWLCAVVAHNTVHAPVFHRRWLNSAFQVWVSLSYGFPISDYIPGHNLSHHRFLQAREDVMRTSKVRFRWNLLNLVSFPFAVTPGILRGNARYKKLKGREAWRRQLQLEVVVVWAVKIGLLALDWRKALCLVVLPQLLANLGIVGINYFWHDGCDPEHPVNHSRNFTGRFLNYVALNNGYHGMHHEESGLHWSLLPEAHTRRIRPGLHPALEQPSLLAYAWRTFVYPGRRETFDGKPVSFRENDGDLDWVLAERSDPQKAA